MKGFKIDTKAATETKLYMKAVLAKLQDCTEPCDIGALNMLMLAYDMYIKSSKQLMNDGPIIVERNGKRVPHPAVSLTKSYWTQVATYQRELGLTIKSRERIKALTPEVDQDNELLSFLKS